MQIRPLITTIAGCCLLAAITTQVHGGFMLVFLLPIFAIWLIYSAFVIWRRPARRKLQAVAVGLWVFVVGGAFLAHAHYQEAARSAGNAAATAILQYKASYGVYPPSLRAAGLESTDWGVYYDFANGTPVLFYPDTFIVFDTYSYNFKQQSWEHQPS